MGDEAEVGCRRESVRAGWPAGRQRRAPRSLLSANGSACGGTLASSQAGGLAETAVDSGWRAARCDTLRNGTGRAESAESGRDPQPTRAHTDVRAHKCKAGAFACSCHRQRHHAERRSGHRRAVHTDRVGVGLSDGRSDAGCRGRKGN